MHSTHTDHFATNEVQYPCGEITPLTIWQVPSAFESLAATKNWQPEHCLSPFGVDW